MTADARLGRAQRLGDQLARWGLVLAAVVQGAKSLPDFDLPWHLALGRHVAVTGRIPELDPLAQAHAPIGYMEVLSDLLLYGLYRAGGELALQLSGALLLVSLVVLELLRARQAGPISLVVATVLIVAVGNWVIVRPATFSLVLLALTLLVLEQHRQLPAARASRLALFSLVPLAGLWVNLHGFAVLGIALIGGYAAYRVACALAAGRLGRWLPREDGTHTREALGAAASALLISGANLAGYRLWAGPLRASADFSRITEWQTPRWSFLLDHELGVVVMLALTLVALALGRELDGRRLPNAFDSGLLVAAAVLGASALRLVPVALILVAPLVARRLAALAPPSPVLCVVAGLSVPLAAPLLWLNTPTSFGVGFDRKQFPERAVQWLLEQSPRGNMYNFLDWGGYLAFRLHPRHLVLIDGRSGWVHSPQLLEQFHASLRDRAAFDALVRQHDIQWAITRAREGERLGAPLAAAEQFTLVFRDDTSAIYVRHDGPNEALAAGGYRLLRHLTGLPVVLDVALGQPDRARDLAHDAMLSVEQDPDSPRAWFIAACSAIAARDGAQLRAARQALAERAPGHPTLGILDEAAARAGLTP